jgi:aminoglycoside phosphotransferase family enzyme/predicted kinase
MLTEDQSEVIAFLESSATHHGETVQRVDTHASIVFLAGSRAWKLKRAVRYDYLDFSTVDRRRLMCEAEVRVNRRLAPTLYRGAVAITRQPDGSLALGGSGVPVDWVVEMTRFDQADVLDERAARGDLDLALMHDLAVTVAQFHATAARRPDRGGPGAMLSVIQGNEAGFHEYGAGILDATVCAEVITTSKEAVTRHAALLDRRRDAGAVRLCHGDLHLRNIVVLEGRPTLFDGIEFNDAIACVDVLYDLAFLLMDLWGRGLFLHANAVFNGYLGQTEDYAGLSLLPLFLSCRAAVRAQTSATAAGLAAAESQQRADLSARARTYLDLARTLLRASPPCLVAVGGFSGSGKSTLARTLAYRVGPVPGAVVLRSDAVRKRLYGIPENTPLGSEGYTADVSRRVYDVVRSRATTILSAGQAVIVDAVHAKPEERLAIEQVAIEADVPFLGLWLDAPEAVLVNRVEGRTMDASDADRDVVRRQVRQGAARVEWHGIDASLGPDAVCRVATSLLPGAAG